MSRRWSKSTWRRREPESWGGSHRVGGFLEQCAAGGVRQGGLVWFGFSRPAGRPNLEGDGSLGGPGHLAWRMKECHRRKGKARCCECVGEVVARPGGQGTKRMTSRTLSALPLWLSLPPTGTGKERITGQEDGRKLDGRLPYQDSDSQQPATYLRRVQGSSVACPGDSNAGRLRIDRLAPTCASRWHGCVAFAVTLAASLGATATESPTPRAQHAMLQTYRNHNSRARHDDQGGGGTAGANAGTKNL